MNRLILMFQFFTRLPIKKTVPVEMEDFKSGSIYLPIVGLVIGVISACAYILSNYTGNNFFAAIIGVFTQIMITGALHLDGLADTCDGIFSSRSKDRMLEIMKDSRIGTMGAIALLFVILTKVSLVSGMEYKSAVYALILTPVIGRISLLYGISIAKYPKKEGLGRTFIENVAFKEFARGLILSAMIIIPILRLYAIIFIALIFIVPQIINRYMEIEIGGMTGDTLGALCEVQEALCLIILSILSSGIWR